MATYDDFDGVYFTLQDLRIHNKALMPDVELIVIDNKATGKTSQELSKFIGDYTLGVNHAASHGCFGARYIPYTARGGTSAPRDQVFRHAKGQFTLCVDSHILLDAGALAKLLDWIKSNPNSKDIISGPIMMDSLTNYHTHYDNFWRGEMWGIWGRAWYCPCGVQLLSVHPSEQGTAVFHILDMNFSVLNTCPVCSRDLPTIKFAGYEQALKQLGWTPADQTDQPFEIPGMGLGLFGMFTDKWPGFNPEARGFGGEELYIHEKVRRAGGRALCLPWLKWGHRFVRVHGIPYTLSRLNKIRNYVLEFQEMGWDIKPIHDHWVSSGLYTQEQWDHLLKHLHDNTINELPKTSEIGFGSVAHLYRHVLTHPRDLNEHAPKIRDLARMCDHITEFSKRQESTIILCAGLSTEAHKKVVSYHTERGQLQQALLSTCGQLTMHQGSGIPGDLPKEPIPPTDMLFIDSHHTYDQLLKELMTHGPQVRRFIVMHDTHANGQRGDDGKPLGLLHAIRSFIIKNPGWRVIYHSEEQYGLTVIGRNPMDFPPERLDTLDFIAGPGTELKLILNSIGIHPGPNCGCRGYMKTMNQWGVQGCMERRLEIAEHIKNMKKQWGWEDGINRLNPDLKTNKWKIIWKTIASGLVFKMNPINPELSLVDLAIARAQENVV